MNVKPEQMLNNEPQPIAPTSSPNAAKPNVVRTAFSCPPYLLTRKEFDYFLELNKPDGACQHKPVKGSFNSLDNHIKILQWLQFGVQIWLYDKALAGCKESLFKLEYNYSIYDEVILKAKQQNLI